MLRSDTTPARTAAMGFGLWSGRTSHRQSIPHSEYPIAWIQVADYAGTCRRDFRYLKGVLGGSDRLDPLVGSSPTSATGAGKVVTPVP